MSTFPRRRYSKFIRCRPRRAVSSSLMSHRQSNLALSSSLPFRHSFLFVGFNADRNICRANFLSRPAESRNLADPSPSTCRAVCCCACRWPRPTKSSISFLCPSSCSLALAATPVFRLRLLPLLLLSRLSASAASSSSAAAALGGCSRVTVFAGWLLFPSFSPSLPHFQFVIQRL